MIRFDTFYDLVKAQAAPEGVGENVVATFRTAVQNGLIAVQTDVPCYRDFHVDFVTKSYVRDFCNTDIFTGPRGTVLNVYAFKPGKDCTKYFYTQKSTSHIQCWIDEQRCTTTLCTPSNSNAIYDSPYCNYPIAGTEGCLPPYLPAGATEDDTSFISDCRDRIFAIGPNYQIFLAPRFPCGYVVAVQWEGIKRTWADADPVFDDEDLKMAVAKFAEAQLAAKDRQWADVSGLKADFIDLTRQMAQRCRRERRTSPPRDCSHQIDHILPFVNPTPDSVSLAVYSDGTPGADSAPLAPSPNLVALNTGHLLWVDAVYGNDGLALREREDRPFLTITAAKNASLSGDTIMVRPGTYNEHDLMKAGIRYYFEDGSLVVWQEVGTGAGYGIFDDRAPGAAGVFSVSGKGQFTYRGSIPAKNFNAVGCVVVTNAATDINFTASQIAISEFNVIGGINGSIAGIYVTNCLLSRFNVDVITDTFELWPNPNQDPLDPDDDFALSVALGVYWEKGEMHLNFRRITSAGYSIWCKEPAGSPTANIWIRGDFISSLHSNAWYISTFTSTNYRLWMNVLEMIAAPTFGTCLSISGPAKVYVDAQKIAGATPVSCGSSITLWLRSEKLTCTAAGFHWVDVTNSTAYITVQEFEDQAGAVSSGINCQNSVVQIYGGRIKTGAGSFVAVTHQSGTTRLIGCLIDTTANNVATNRPITVTTDGLQLQNCVILAGSNADSSIFANAAKNVRMHAYSVATKAAHANITLNPNAAYLIVDANAGL